MSLEDTHWLAFEALLKQATFIVYFGGQHFVTVDMVIASLFAIYYLHLYVVQSQRLEHFRLKNMFTPILYFDLLVNFLTSCPEIILRFSLPNLYYKISSPPDFSTEILCFDNVT